MGISHTPRKLSWETQFLGGLNLRSLLILACSLPAAGSAILTPLIPGPVWLRILLGFGITVLSLVLVFAKFSGRTFEQWLLDVASWRWSGRRWIWRRGVSPPAGEVIITPGPTVRAVAARLEPPRTEDIVEPRYTVLGLAFNLVVILLLTGLTIYLAGGASAEVQAWWRALTAVR